MADLIDHPFHPAQVAHEGGASDAGERRWFTFVAEAERLLGHDLDGNDVDEAGCGYSLDEAYDAWEAGSSASAYVANVKARPRYQPFAA